MFQSACFTLSLLIGVLVFSLHSVSSAPSPHPNMQVGRDTDLCAENKVKRQETKGK